MPFNPKTVDLQDSNLIEASAGTGKTYSIAIMALRLVVEQNIKIQEILMVTFTKAAVAELETRVRAFIRLGLKVARGNAIDDTMITSIVSKAIADEDRETITKRLYEANLFLDETSVLTIHSFCQKVLKEFSFETNQIFGAEAISPDEYNQLIEDHFNEYWRKKITTLDVRLLKGMIAYNFSRDGMLEIVKGGLAGKKPTVTGGVPANFLSAAHINKLLNGEEQEQEKRTALKEQILNYIQEWGSSLEDKIKAGGVNPTKTFLPLIAPELRMLLFDMLIKKASTHYMTKTFGVPFVALLQSYAASLNISEDQIRLFIAQIAIDAFNYVQQRVAFDKQEKGHITFDDMIVSLKNALSIEENKQTLTAALNEKYKAVFIDEFQDTDKDQYLIFHTLFQQHAILFYIGDPKQSIYGWRKADMATYFQAKNEVTHLHDMNENHRSSKSFIRAMNQFFLPTENFDSFHYEKEEDGINYIPVDSPEQNTKGCFLYDAEEPASILISTYKDKSKLKGEIKKLLYGLLHTPYFIAKEGAEPESVKPSDIGILVRRNDEAELVKSILSSLGIASVTINDSKLFESDEAKELYYIMMAVYDNTVNNINRALFTKMGGYTPESFATIHKEAVVERFKTYQETWKKEGVYVMLRQFLSDHNLSAKFYDTALKNPERMVSNVLQLVEIIHKISERKNYDLLEQLQWLKKGLDGELREGDEYEQRLEREEEAVKIVTIHKSKGLEYKVVVAPFLDFTNNIPKKYESFSYRNPENGDYLVVDKKLATEEEEEWYKTQTEQENRRLLYVAITRAKYQCFILTKENGSSTVKKFTDAIAACKEADENALPDIAFWEIPTHRAYLRATANETTTQSYAVAQRFELVEKNWRKASFTALSPEHQVMPSPRYEGLSTDAYDTFIFRDLKKGAQTGNLLHYIFENINFTEPNYWGNTIDKAVKRLAANKSQEFMDKLNVFLHQILDTQLPMEEGFALNQVPMHDRLTELEFDFPLQQINMREIEKRSTEQAPLHVRSNDEMEGIMTGKIDLFFRHNGKYYILDWKSNYLGETTNDYNREKMQAAMSENNYHLQYHIYTVAAHKYLSNRLANWDYDTQFGGVIYLFVRGVRNGSDTGIYLARPEKAHIEALSVLLSGR